MVDRAWKKTSEEAAARALSSPPPQGVYIHLSELAWCRLGLNTSPVGPVGRRAGDSGPGGRKEPSHLPPPQARRVKDISRQPGSQTGRALGTLGFRGGCGRSSSWLQALPPRSGQAEGPRNEVRQSFQMRTWSQQHPVGAGGVFSQDTHLSPLPPCPRVRTPEQNQAPENQPSRQRWQGEGGAAGHFGISKADT